MGILGTHPAVFVRVAKKGDKSGQRTSMEVRPEPRIVQTSERRNVGKGQGADGVGLTCLAMVRTIIHDPCYHELHYLSTTIIVLVLSKLPYLFERFCKEKKTKG